jgi:hypothetical protein
MGDAADQGCEYQGRDDHLDQAQEQHRDQVYVRCDIRPCIGQIVEDQRSHHNAEHNCDQDVLREPVGHYRPHETIRRAEFGRFREQRNTLEPAGAFATRFPIWDEFAAQCTIYAVARFMRGHCIQNGHVGEKIP